ncbi:MAG: class III extradiol ring-cleavage dioxygenase [Myxococcota bacterium]
MRRGTVFGCCALALGCRPESAPATPAPAAAREDPGGPDNEWKELPFLTRHSRMTFTVLPVMGRRFQSKGAPTEYRSPDNAALHRRAEALLANDHAVKHGSPGGLQHTTWMPLLHLRPQADVPVVELALPFVTDRELFELGRTLAPLRDEGVMLLCSGSLTHNLATLGQGDGVAPWAQQFDEWVLRTIDDGDYDALIDWRRAAPHAFIAHPDDGGHYDVLLIGLGAATATAKPVARYPVSGFEMGTLAKRGIELR